ncbi:MAG: ABC transporter substrate-binding protein [Clostridiales bacterium]
MKKILVIFCLSLMLLATGCGGDNKDTKDEATQADNMEITVAVMPSIDKIPIIVGDSMGFFEKRGLTVNVENFQSPTDRNAALQGGKVDAVMSDMVADVLYLQAGLDMKITSLIQTDFAIIANGESGIKTFEDITPSHTNGIALNCLMEYIADKAGDSQKIMVPDVMTRIEQVLSGDIDLAVVPEPYGSMAVERGAVKVGTAADLDIYAAVMLFPTEFIKENPKAVKAFYEGYNDAVKYLDKNGMANVMEDVTAKGEFPQSTQKALGKLKFVPLQAPSQAQFDDIQGWMTKHPEFKGPYNYKFEDVTDFSFLTQK